MDKGEIYNESDAVSTRLIVCYRKVNVELEGDLQLRNAPCLIIMKTIAVTRSL